MRVAITGASGHIGGNLARALVARGDTVVALVHDAARSLDGVDVKRVDGDVRDADSLARAFRDVERVFHLAARISISAQEDPAVEAINVGGTRNALASARAAGVKRFIHFSSIHAISPLPLSAMVDETRPLVEGPGELPYDRSKAAAQREVMKGAAEGFDALVVNPTAVIGPHDFAPSHVGKLLVDLAQRRMPGLVDGGFSWVDVRDVVAGALAAAERGRAGEAYLLSGHWLSVRDLALVVERVTGARPPRIVSPMWLARACAPFATAWAKLRHTTPRLTSASLKALRHHRHISSAKAEAELGYTSRPTEETLRDTFAWFRARGVLDGK